jgi:hypothetical protein
MFRLITLLVLLLATQSVAAKIYRCVDPATGQATFTDVACAENRASEDKIRATPGNFGASGGHKEGRSKYRKTWLSQDPERRSDEAPGGPGRTGAGVPSPVVGTK